jgi:hypothetical protein
MTGAPAVGGRQSPWVISRAHLMRSHPLGQLELRLRASSTPTRHRPHPLWTADVSIGDHLAGALERAGDFLDPLEYLARSAAAVLWCRSRGRLTSHPKAAYAAMYSD